MISNLPSNFANAITPYTPLGRQPVGEENPESRNTPFKPVEESANSAELLNRRNPEDQKALNATSNRVVSAAQDDDQGSNAEEQGSDEARAQEQRQQRLQEERQQQQDQQQIRELASRDREVRQHERAHAAVGGELAGAPSFDYERGPDGLRYAVSGEVPIRLSESQDDPQATLELARQVRRAALAPEEPSAQDRRVAAQATQIEYQAQQQLADLERQQAEAEAEAATLTREESQLQQEARQADEEKQQRQQQQDERNELLLQQQEAEANARLQEINRRTLELNQRILSIATTSPTPDVGSLLDQII